MRSLILLLAAACGAPADTDADGSETDETDDTGTSVDADCSDDVPTSGTALWGRVTDAEGAPLGRAAARVQYCRGTTCLFPLCHDDEGRYVFGDLDAGAGSYLVKPLGDAARFPVFFPLTLGDSPVEQVTSLPDRREGVAIPATRAEIEIAPGVFVTVGAGDLPAEVGQPEPTSIAALDATDRDLPIVGVPSPLQAVYLLAPFQEKPGETSLPMRFDVAGWPDGSYRLWMGAYDTSSWEDLGPLRGSDSGLVVAEGPDRLTTLVVARDEEPSAR